MSRHQARETALKMLFQIDIGGNSWDMAELTLEEAALQANDGNFAVSLIHTVQDNAEEINLLIQKYSQEWDIERLANVDKIILRIALGELKYLSADVPANVAINEAIELAKIYSTDDSSRFINGILDTILNNEINVAEKALPKAAQDSVL